mmetsp:Transcript_60396/g.197639  ORF Transcript_60396/g.197639 Transcript_60396/m.197639 type:complete len:251 (+) Transcript_60396:816-1568(+)
MSDQAIPEQSPRGDEDDREMSTSTDHDEENVRQLPTDSFVSRTRAIALQRLVSDDEEEPETQCQDQGEETSALLGPEHAVASVVEGHDLQMERHAEDAQGEHEDDAHPYRWNSDAYPEQELPQLENGLEVVGFGLEPVVEEAVASPHFRRVQPLPDSVEQDEGHKWNANAIEEKEGQADQEDRGLQGAHQVQIVLQPHHIHVCAQDALQEEADDHGVERKGGQHGPARAGLEDALPDLPSHHLCRGSLRG